MSVDRSNSNYSFKLIIHSFFFNVSLYQDVTICTSNVLQNSDVYTLRTKNYPLQCQNFQCFIFYHRISFTAKSIIKEGCFWYVWIVCLFECAPEVINGYDILQKWVVPWFGVQPHAQEHFYWSSSRPRCYWDVVWGGKGKTKRQDIISCPKNPPLKWLILCSTWLNNTHITGR